MDWQFSIEWILGFVGTVVAWLASQAFRIEKRVSKVEQDIQHSRELRTIDHKSIIEINGDVKEIKKFLMEKN